jgi:hypothetical protein
MLAAPATPGLLGSPEDAETFLREHWMKRSYVRRLPSGTLLPLIAALDGLSPEVLFARGSRAKNGLTQLCPTPAVPPPGVVAGSWAARLYAEGRGFEVRGVEGPTMMGFGKRLGQELLSPIQACECSLLVLPTGCEVPLPSEGMFLMHVRGAPCSIMRPRDMEAQWELGPDMLSYVPPTADIGLRAQGECLLLGVRFTEEPAWRVIALLVADKLSEHADGKEALAGLFCPGDYGRAARDRLGRLLESAQKEVASWSLDDTVRNYAIIEAGAYDEIAEGEGPTNAPGGDNPSEAEAEVKATGTEGGDGPKPPAADDSDGGPTFMYADTEWGIRGIARRADDIHISPFKRSGTTWTQMILFQLLSDGDVDKIAHMYEFSPYPFYELRTLGTAERIDRLPSPRVIKSHEAFQNIHHPLGRYIYVARDGMDVAVSAFHHHMGVGNGPIPFDVFFDRFVTEGRWVKEVAEWWAQRDQPNVLFLTFRELTDNLASTVEKIARFCGLDLSPEKLASVVRNSSFANMKLHEAKFDHNEGIHWLLSQRKGASFIRKGKSSEGAAMLSEAQKRRFREAYAHALSGTGLELDR